MKISGHHRRLLFAGLPSKQRGGALIGNAVVVWACAVGLCSATAQVPEPFGIQVVDAATGRGVPLVELKTVHDQTYVTDSQGWVALTDPELMGQRVFFHVRSHGYTFPADGFGSRGRAFEVEPGESARIEVERRNLADRLYRVTGGGIYRDSVLLGHEVPIREPLLNAQVFGSDSVQAQAFEGRIHWFWGDTNRPSYPLGNFHVPGATSRLPEDGGLDPSKGVDLVYEVDENGFAAETCRMPGEGPTWISGLCVIEDENGHERMFAGYVKVRQFLDVYEHGLVEWDPEAKRFRQVKVFEEDQPIYPHGHTFVRNEPNGRRFVYFGDPFPLTRVPAEPEALQDLSRYEGFTCLEPGTRFEDGRLDRGPDGRLRFDWKPNTPPLSEEQRRQLVEAGTLGPDEPRVALEDVETGRRVVAHRGSVAWNPYRERWIAIICEVGGEPSNLGEIWYAEAAEPTGPWREVIRVVTHEDYSFYNPKHHPFFDQDDGRLIYFEGTYTKTFSGNPVATPRYNYNQIMYRLDLSDPRLQALADGDARD